MQNEPPPSWEVFGICNTCGTDNKKPCYDLRSSTPKNLVVAKRPHKGRKMLERSWRKKRNDSQS